MSKIPQTIYTCFKCRKEWRPRSPRPGDSIYCPKCGEYHSTRKNYLEPPKPRVYIPPGEPVKHPPKSNPIKPRDKKTYQQKGFK